jgi:cyanophycin synthetase
MRNQSQYLWVAGKFLFKKAAGFIKNLSRVEDEYENELAKENSVLIDAASKLNIQVSDHGGGMLELNRRGRTTFIRGNATELESAISHKIAGDKYLVSQILSKSGLPAPFSAYFTLPGFKEACKYFLNIKKPAVVKPRRGTSGGTGVSAGIESLKQFKKAFFEAALYDRYVMVEEFVEGENIRLLILEDQLLSAVKRIPAYVTGDGRSTIKKLIKKTNQSRLSSTSPPKLWPIRINNDLHLSLQRQELSLNSVIPEDKKVFVKTLCNGHQGGVVEEVTNITHPDYIELSIQALTLCKVKFGGVDFITPDISQPFIKSGGCINEINTTPSFYGHYQASNRDEIQNSAEKFLKYIFENGSG